MEPTISIAKKEYNELLRDSLKLQAFVQHGIDSVDNWDWWDEAMNTYHELLEEHGLDG